MTFGDFDGEEKYEYGNALIKGIINNEKLCTMKINDLGGNAASAVDINAACDRSGSNMHVKISKKDIETWVIGSENIVEKSDRPAYIGIAHELVHALRGMKGIQYNDSIKEFNKYKTINSENGGIVYSEQQELKEELATTGLISSNFIITENKIRQEHGLPIRGYY